jgi:glutamate-5-semialdehyde dehydrogenase
LSGGFIFAQRQWLSAIKKAMISKTKKNEVLTELAALIAQNEARIIAANHQDVEAYKGDDESMLDRLRVDAKKVALMVDAVRNAIKLNDPEGVVLYTYLPENGLHIENKTVPFGNILIIYESRPDVTIEAAVTAFKAGNHILLKGGKEARNTNLVLIELWQEALKVHDVPPEFVAYLDYSREQTQKLIRENTHQVDLIIPRGGEALIDFVKTHTDIPIIVSGRGNNFMYVDDEVNFEMAINLILNGKSRISVCNALDKVLFHQSIPDLSNKINHLVAKLEAHQIEILGDVTLSSMHQTIKPVHDEAVYFEEFLSAKIMVSYVENMPAAIQMINRYSGHHSATIVTTNQKKADQFLAEVDCAAVYHNASTRFTDGGQFGFGAEMAISTQKVHFRGPIGIDQLVTNKWVIRGNGQIRE